MTHFRYLTMLSETNIMKAFVCASFFWVQNIRHQRFILVNYLAYSITHLILGTNKISIRSIFYDISGKIQMELGLRLLRDSHLDLEIETLKENSHLIINLDSQFCCENSHSQTLKNLRHID